jgi:hypothetical protein
MNARRHLRNAAIALSLGCLFLSPSIWNILYPSLGFRSWGVDVSPVEASATIAILGVLLAIFFACLTLIDLVPEGRAKTEVRILFLVISCAFFGGMGSIMFGWLGLALGSSTAFLLPAFVLAGCVMTSIRSRNKIATAESRMRGLLMLLFPAAVIVSVNCAFISLKEEQDHAASIPAPSQTIPGTKIIWVIFDELDSAAMINRPPHIQLPAFEKLIGSSFVGVKCQFSGRMHSRSNS